MVRRNNDFIYGIVFIFLCLSTTSFIWFYRNPLNVDMPMHVAIAKAFWELLKNPYSNIYPYILNIKFSTYALPEIILSIIIGIFGVSLGTNVALSLYAISFPLSIAYLVKCINPESRWTRLIGFPLTLNYFFHWGFWPSLLGTIAAILSIAFSIKYETGKKGIIINSSGRFFTMLMHPAPLLGLIIYDFAAILIDVRNNKYYFNPLKWNWKKMILVWSIPLISIIIMSQLVDHTNNKSFFILWGSMKSQLIQIFRPLFITRNFFEFLIPLILGGFITYKAFRHIKYSQRNMGILISAIFLIILGFLLPRDKFWGGSWEIGARIVFLGWILFFSIWAASEKYLKKWIILWIILAFSINIAISHLEWSKYNKSFGNVINALSFNGTNGRATTKIDLPPKSPDISVNLGLHVAAWAWCEDKVSDAYNAVAEMNDFGPVKYIGIDSTLINDKSQTANYMIIYHPFSKYILENTIPTDSVIYDDLIYTIYKD